MYAKASIYTLINLPNFYYKHTMFKQTFKSKFHVMQASFYSITSFLSEAILIGQKWLHFEV